MKTPVLHNWSVRANTLGPYDPPETRRITVSGAVFHSLKFQDGERITTSYIVGVSGVEINTHSGSVYRLGTPNEDYMDWCRENGCHVPTPEEPIKL
jgi:hypothetical protein